VVLDIKNLLILGFAIECKPKVCSLVPTKKKVIALPKWD
jgi:hypothetical protein